MSVASRARALLTPLRTLTNARLLRRLLRAQESTATALHQQNRTLAAIGKVLASASGQQWSALLQDRPPDEAWDEGKDESGVSYVNDDLMGQVETVKRDYEARFGRIPDDDEALKVVADHQMAQREVS